MPDDAPSFVRRIADHLHGQGHDDGMPMAVNTVKRWAKGANHDGPLTPETVAKAAAAIAELEGVAVAEAKLTAAARHALPKAAFALPGERYPIHDLSHARNALARCSGKPEEAQVRAAVYKRWPGLKPGAKKKKVTEAWASPDELAALGARAARDLTLAEGLLMGLSGEHPRMSSLRAAEALLEGRDSIVMGKPGQEVPAAQVAPARRSLATEIDVLRGLVEACGTEAPAVTKRKGKRKRQKMKKKVEAEAKKLVEAPPDGGPLAAAQARAANATAAKPGAKAKSRDPKRDAGSAQAKKDFEAKHPRAAKGRAGGGKWVIKKGEGYGEDGPQPVVQQLQERLEQLGYVTEKDGKFGVMTEIAVKAFQRDFGLDQTGQIDEQTTLTIRHPPPKKAAEVNAEIDQAAGDKSAATAKAALGGDSVGVAGSATVARENEQAKKDAAEAAGKKAGAKSSAKGAATKAAKATPAASGAANQGKAEGSKSNDSGDLLDPSDPASIKAFQKANGLTVDGIIGPETQAALRDAKQSDGRDTGDNMMPEVASDAPSNQRTSATSKVASKKKAGAKGMGGESLHKGQGMGAGADRTVKDFQSLMDELGFDVGGVDGRFGPDTVKAVKKLQRRYGLKPDGIVGKNTKALLKRLVKRSAAKEKEAKKANAVTEAVVRMYGEDSEFLADVMALDEAAIVDYRSEPRQDTTPVVLKDHRSEPVSPAASFQVGDYRTETVTSTTANTVIVDYRSEPVQSTESRILQDYRSYLSPDEALAEAVAARKAANTPAEFIRARARENVIRLSIREGRFDPRLHPRARGGRFAEKPGSYFNLNVEGKYGKPVQSIPVADITPIRARPKGIEHAKTFMEEAARGEKPKRDPIVLIREGDGYRIFDGNSTYAVAADSDWKNLPALVAEDEAEAQRLVNIWKGKRG